MKKMFAAALFVICLLGLVGCGTAANDNATEAFDIPKEDLPGFSYEETMYPFVTDGVKFSGDVELKNEGFYNIAKSEITTRNEALEWAKLECTISYERTSVFYDSSTDMFLVHFFTTENGHRVGEDFQVILDSDGVIHHTIHSK